jgi:transposase
VKQWATTRLQDLPVAGRPVRLRWRKRRWYCPTPACPRKSVTEQVAQVPARARLTMRLRQAAGAAVADGGRTIVQSARDHGISWPIVADAFTAHATGVRPAEPEPVAVLGIDEVRRGKPHWRWDEQAGFVDHDRGSVARRLLRPVRRPRVARGHPAGCHGRSNCSSRAHSSSVRSPGTVQYNDRRFVRWLWCNRRRHARQSA